MKLIQIILTIFTNQT